MHTRYKELRSEVNSIDAGETKKAALEATLTQKKAKAAQLSADIAALQAKQASMEASLVPPAQSGFRRFESNF